MIIQRATIKNCHTANGTVVVIDVLHALTTAAYVFDTGAEDITLVSTIEEAFTLREQMTDELLMGEVDDLPIPGFDLFNSPVEFIDKYLKEQHLIQRKTSCTQGVVRSTAKRTKI